MHRKKANEDKLSKINDDNVSDCSSTHGRLNFDFLHEDKPKKHAMADAKKHAELEKEYRRLRRQIAATSETNQNCKEHDRVTHKELISPVSSPQRLGAGMVNHNIELPTDRLQTDTLGMNHFRKHILNVKASSKRFKRSLKGTDQKTNSKRVPFKFKPLYERQMSEDALCGHLNNGLVNELNTSI